MFPKSKNQLRLVVSRPHVAEDLNTRTAVRRGFLPDVSDDNQDLVLGTGSQTTLQPIKTLVNGFQFSSVIGAMPSDSAVFSMLGQQCGDCRFPSRPNWVEV